MQPAISCSCNIGPPERTKDLGKVGGKEGHNHMKEI